MRDVAFEVSGCPLLARARRPLEDRREAPADVAEVLGACRAFECGSSVRMWVK